MGNGAKKKIFGTFLCLIVAAMMLSGLVMVLGGDESHFHLLEDGNEKTPSDQEMQKKELYKDFISHHPNPAPVALAQPDGTEFYAETVGDRIGGHLETFEGYTILQDSQGWWVYSDLDVNGDLLLTDHRVGKVDISTLNLEKHQKSSGSMDIEYDLASKRGTRAPPTVGDAKAVALMIEFSDVTFGGSHTQAYFQDMLFNDTSGTMRDYYLETSYGLFNLTGDVYGPFQDTVNTMAWYGHDVTDIDEDEGVADPNDAYIFKMAKKAVELADVGTDGFDEDHGSDGPDLEVNFSQYDGDGDGEIDYLIIIHAGSGQEESWVDDDIWSHQWNIRYWNGMSWEEGWNTQDGVKAYAYNTGPEDGEIGVFCHEFGHTLGLPDLYDTDGTLSGGDSDTIGDWGIMASGSWNGNPSGSSPAHFCAWAKIKMGWVEPIIVTSDISLSTIEIPPIETHPVVYKMWAHNQALNTSEYFLIENRQQIGYDTTLPGEGILIWHIDETVGTIAENNVNNNPFHLRVDLEEAGGPPQDMQQGNNAGDAGDPWVSNVTGFRDSSDPTSDSYNGSATGVWVWNISGILPDDNMTLGFNEVNTGPTGIYITDPVSDITIAPVYDFILNDSDFPDEDVGTSPGSFVLQHSPPGMGSWSVTPLQNPISWIGGIGGIINCTGLPNGTWDFRVKITDEEGHVIYTQILTNIMIVDLEPPIADAGPDNSTDEDSPIVLDGSGSTDNTGFIVWYNWTFGDGNYSNGSGPANAIKIYTYENPGFYTVILNVSDGQGNWDTDTVNITVYDATPPNTTLTIGNPKHRENTADAWNVTSATTFTLSAMDEYSSLNFTWYTINSDYHVYSGPFDFGSYGEGVYTFVYGSEDTVGNNDSGITLFINVDDSEPTTSLDIDTPKHGDGVVEINVTSTTVFTVNVSDNYSGVDVVWWYVDGIETFTTTTMFDFSSYGEGTYTLYFGASDNLGNNNTTPNSITVIVDNQKPITTLTIGNPKYGDEITEINVTSSTLFTLSPVDNIAGVNFTWYTIDGNYFLYSAPFDFNLMGEGIYMMVYGSEDYVGHNESGTPLTVKVDDTKPVSSLVIADPKHGGEIIDINVTSTTQFTISASDNMVGLNTIWWYVNNMGNYFETTPFNFSNFGEGVYILYYGARDLLNNNETTPPFITVIVDDTKPQTQLTIGTPKHGGEVTDINVTPNTPFYLDGVDLDVGLDTEWWYINDLLNYTEGGTFTFTGKAEGDYTLYYGSRDLLGNNETVHAIIVYVDRQPPFTEPLDADNPSHRKYDFDGWNVTNTTTLIINSSDDFSGVEFSWYILDGEYFVGNNFNLSGKDEGKHTVVFGNQDNLGYNETGHTEHIYLDFSPPNSNITLGGFKTRDNDEDDWNVTGSTIFTITSEDRYSGVEVIWYTVDGKYYEDISFTLDGESDGKHVITWGAIDRVGNNETGNVMIVYADTHPPETRMEINGPQYRLDDLYDWNVTYETTFTLVPSDNVSGINYTWVTIDGISIDETNFDLKDFSEGKHIIRWGSADFAENIEDENMKIVYIDNSTPFSELIIGKPSFRDFSNDYLNITSYTPLDISSYDNHSGVDVVWHTINDAYFEGSKINMSGYEDGLYRITWGARDNLNFNETGNLEFLYLDNTPPKTELSIGDPKYRELDVHVWNVTKSTYFSLSSEDKSCGVESIWYTIDGVYHKNTDFFLTGSFDGLHNISYGARDCLGNNETLNYTSVYLDTTPPTVTIYIGGEAVTQSPVSINSSTPIVLEAQDASSGVSFIWFSLDGSSDSLIYQSQFTVPVNTTKITYGAQDNIGNNASGAFTRVVVKDEEEVIDGDGDGEDESVSFGEEIVQFFTDYSFILIIIIVVIILVAILAARRKKGGGEEVPFQEEEENAPPFQVEEEEFIQDENEVEFGMDDEMEGVEEVDWDS
jgi:M6 family metalloprotease-like protein